MKKNIVLIGLMGSGKTTIGKKLAEALQRPFIDVDEEIEKLHGPISKLFEKGESHFRAIETQIVRALSEKENVVISTGGGVVLRSENMECLTESGMIFYLVRPIEAILETVDPTNRPLLKNGVQVLYQLEKERDPLYKRYSDYSVDASDMDQAVMTMVSLWNKGL